LVERDVGCAPRTGEHREALDGEVLERGEGPLVVPVADHDIFRDAAERGVRLVGAGFPLAEAGALAVEETIAPHPHGAFRAGEVIVQRGHLLRE
jgi:hypothetical protein